MEQKYLVALVINSFVFAALKATDQDFIYIMLNFLSYLLTFAIIFIRLANFSRDVTPQQEDQQWEIVDEEQARYLFLNLLAFYNGLISRVTDAESTLKVLYNFKFLILAYGLSVVGSVMSLKTTVWVLVNLYCLIRLAEGHYQRNAREEWIKYYSKAQDKVTQLANKIPRYEKTKQQ